MIIVRISNQVILYCVAAGEAWNGLQPEIKKPFEQAAEREKLSYEQKMKDYNQVRNLH